MKDWFHLLEVSVHRPPLLYCAIGVLRSFRLSFHKLASGGLQLIESYFWLGLLRASGSPTGALALRPNVAAGSESQSQFRACSSGCDQTAD